MRETVTRYLFHFVFGFYLLYVISSTFSIAATQITLGLSLIGFLTLIAVKPFNPFSNKLLRFYLIVAMYIGWMILSSLMGPTPVTSVIAVKEEWLFLAIPIGVYLCANNQYRRYLVTAFAVSVAVVGAYGVLQHFIGIDWFRVKPLIPAKDFGYLVCGNFPHPLTFGNYFVTASGFLLTLGLASKHEFAQRYRILFIISALLAGSAAIFSYSRGSILALVFGVLLLILIRGRRYWLYGISVIIVAIGILFLTPNLSDRVESNLQRELSTNDKMGRPFIWKNSFSLVKENPLFGVGLENFRVEYAKRLPTDVQARKKHVHAHNDLINIAANGGIPAMLFYIGIWLVILYLFWIGQRSPPKTNQVYLMAALIGSVVFLVSSVTEATFADEEVREMLMFIWAIGLGSLYKQHETTSTDKTS